MSQITIVIDCQEDLSRRELNNIVAESHKRIHSWLQYTKQDETILNLSMGIRKYSIAVEIKK